MISPALPPYIRVIEIKKTPIGDEKFLAVMKSYNFALRLKQKKPRQGTIIKIICKGGKQNFTGTQKSLQRYASTWYVDRRNVNELLVCL